MLYGIVGIVVMVIVGMVISTQMSKKYKQDLEGFIDFEKENPNCAKVYYQPNVLIHRVAGEQYMPDQDTDNISKGHSWKDSFSLKSGENFQQITNEKELGFYVIPGDITFNVSATDTKTNTLTKKTVVTTVRAIDIDILIEPNKSYDLSYDFKAKQFVFVER